MEFLWISISLCLLNISCKKGYISEKLCGYSNKYECRMIVCKADTWIYNFYSLLFLVLAYVLYVNIVTVQFGGVG
jgi:hypothetical protein